MKSSGVVQKRSETILYSRPVEKFILTIRGQRVIVDADLASVYGVPTRRLNEQVKRNADRFPSDFMFRLTKNEQSEVIANCDHLVRLKYSKSLPLVFTEHGAIMAATVLNSPQAVAMSVFVVRAFVRMREQLTANAAILKRLAEIDKTLLEHDHALGIVWEKLQPLLAPPPEPPKKRMGFNADRET